MSRRLSREEIDELVKKIAEKKVTELTEEDKEILREWLALHRGRWALKIDSIKKSKRIPVYVATWLNRPYVYDIPGVDTPVSHRLPTAVSGKPPRPKIEAFKPSEEQLNSFTLFLGEFEHPPHWLSDIENHWVVESVKRLGRYGAVVTLVPRSGEGRSRYKRLVITARMSRNGILASLELERIDGRETRLDLLLDYGVVRTHIAGTVASKAFDEIAQYLGNPRRIEVVARILNAIREGRLDEIPGKPSLVLDRLRDIDKIVVTRELEEKARELDRRYDPIDAILSVLTYIVEDGDLLAKSRFMRETFRRGYEYLVKTDDERLASLAESLFPGRFLSHKDVLGYIRRLKEEADNINLTDTATSGRFFSYALGPEMIEFIYLLGRFGPNVDVKSLRARLRSLIDRLEPLIRGSYLWESIIENMRKISRTTKFAERALPLLLDLDMLLSNEEFMQALNRLPGEVRAEILSQLARDMYETREARRGRWGRNKVVYGVEPFKFIRKYVPAIKLVNLLNRINAHGIAEIARDILESAGLSGLGGYNIKVEESRDNVKLVLEKNGRVIGSETISPAKIMNSIIEDVVWRGAEPSWSLVRALVVGKINALLSSGGILITEKNIPGIGKVVVEVSRDEGFRILHPYLKSYGRRLGELGDDLLRHGGKYEDVARLIQQLEVDGEEVGIKPEDLVTGKIERLGESVSVPVKSVLYSSKSPKLAIFKGLDEHYILWTGDRGVILDIEGLDKFKQRLAELVAESTQAMLPFKYRKPLIKWLEQHGVRIKLTPIRDFTIKTGHRGYL